MLTLTRAFVLAAGLWTGLLAMPQALASEAPLFAFVDVDGVVHITDRLGDVPEPYYSVYRAREAERGQQPHPPVGEGAAAREVPRPEADDGPRPSSPPTPGPAAGQQALRRAWQVLMAQWRQELVATARALQEAQAQAQGASNPVLKQTPQGRLRFEESQKELTAIRAKAMQAREMVVKVLPERAKKEHVPPQWLTP